MDLLDIFKTVDDSAGNFMKIAEAVNLPSTNKDSRMITKDTT